MRIGMVAEKMVNESNQIDIDKLRKDMREESLGAYLGGGFGAALIESFDVDNASDDELIKMAQIKGIRQYYYKK